MRSRWNDAEAAALEGLDLLVYASRLVGAETSLDDDDVSTLSTPAGSPDSSRMGATRSRVVPG